MDRSMLRLATVVLAAGAGSRFGLDPGAKLLAELEGKPILAHVLDTVRATIPATTIVVLGRGADDIERTLAWSDEIRVRNHEPERGLASSLQVGIDALRALPDETDGAFIVLGDQPRLRRETMEALAGAAQEELTAAGAATAHHPAAHPVIVPRYQTTDARNPVLLLRSAWPWVDEIEGDHGLAALIDARPEQALHVEAEGDMPDVDTTHDLDRVARHEDVPKVDIPGGA